MESSEGHGKKEVEHGNEKKKDTDEKKQDGGGDEKEVKRTKWVGFGLPFRPLLGTYEFFDAEAYPDVLTSEFNHIQTVSDVVQNGQDIQKRIDSPTGCAIVTSHTADGQDLRYQPFYMDSQCCVTWFQDAKTLAIYASSPDGGEMQCVARSMPEFWARLAMECDIWSLLDRVCGDDSRPLYWISHKQPTFKDDVAKLDVKSIWEE